MNLNTNYISYFIGFLCALIVVVATNAISKLPYNYLFSILFGLLTFIIYCRLIDAKINLSAPSTCAKFSTIISRDILVLMIYVLSIVLVIFIPSITDFQFVNWSAIPAINYVRLFAGLLLSSILPGYGLLRLIDQKKRFTGLNSVIFSFFISVFLTSLLSYALIVLNLPVTNTYWLTLLVNLAILSFFSFSVIRKRGDKSTNQSKLEPAYSYKIDYLIIACIFAFFVIGWLIYYSSYQLGSSGDMWDHYSTFIRILKGGNILSPDHLAYLGGETWFALHYVTVFQLAGFPSLNGWMIYAFINFFYILAVYQAVRGIVGINHPKIPAIATVITTLFAGFGWVVALSLSSGESWLTALNTAGSMTYNDIIYVFLYGPIPQYLSLAVLFSLLYLMARKSKFDISTAFLTIILVALGLLVHSPEIVMLPIFYYCYLLFVSPEEFGRLSKFSLSILIGLLAVFIMGLPFPSHFYFNTEGPLLFMFITISLTFVLVRLRAKGNHYPAFLRRMDLLIGVVWILYFLSFLAWDSTLNLNVTGTLSVVGLKPWFIYPINSGMSLMLGLLGLTCLVVWRQSKLENSKFLVSTVVAFFLTGIVLSYVNINIFATGYWEKRFYSFMIVPLSVLGAFFAAEVIPKIALSKSKGFKVPHAKYAVTGLLISLIIISGVSSNILALDRIKLASQGDPYATASNAELKALDFLRANASVDATVLGFSTVSNRFAYVFSGMNHLNSPYWFTKGDPYQFIDITNPELALKMLYSLNITYLYLTKSDMKTLQSNGFIVNHLLKYLPIAFQNDAVTIYQIPKMNPPSSDSNLTIAIPSYMFDALSDQNILLQELPQQLLFNETFTNYANGSSGTPIWTPVNGTWIVANGFYTGNESKWKISSTLVTGDNLSDFSLKTDFKITSGYYAGVAFRSADSSNFYAALISVDGKNDDLYKMVNGSLVLIKHSTGPSIGGNWNTLEVTTTGNQFTVKLNGELILSVSDALFPNGRIGLLVDSSSSSFDNVTITQPPDIGLSVDCTFYLPIDMLAQSGLDYSVKTTDDGSLFNSKYILLPSDKGWNDQQINDYLAWVNNGGRLIVLDSDGMGDFARMLSIDSNSNKIFANSAVSQSAVVELGGLSVTSLFSNDEQVKVVASYTNGNSQSAPLAFVKQVGNGEIFYLTVNPFFENLYSASGNARTDFQKIGDLLNLSNLNAPIFKDTPPDARWKYIGYDVTSIQDYAQLEGSVKIESDSTILPYNQFNVQTLEIVNATGTITGSYVREPLLLQNVAIKDLIEKAATHSVIDSKSICMIPTDYGSYSALLSEPAFNISMQILDGDVSFSVMTSENKIYQIDLQCGTLFMENITTASPPTTSDVFVDATLQNDIIMGSRTLLLVYTPSVSVNGTASFPEAYIPNYINYVNGYSVQINGTANFNFDCSSDNVILLTDFGYSGNFYTNQETTKISMSYWEFGCIPWAVILISPLFLIFCILLAMAAIIIYSIFSTSKNKRSSN